MKFCSAASPVALRYASIAVGSKRGAGSEASRVRYVCQRRGGLAASRSRTAAGARDRISEQPISRRVRRCGRRVSPRTTRNPFAEAEIWRSHSGGRKAGMTGYPRWPRPTRGAALRGWRATIRFRGQGSDTNDPNYVFGSYRSHRNWFGPKSQSARRQRPMGVLHSMPRP